MRLATRLSLSIIICAGGLLMHAIPAAAASKVVGSGRLAPVKGKQMVYESYISDQGCQPQSGSAPSFTGGATVFVADGTATGSELKLSCPNGYAMVNSSTKTTGGFGTAVLGGGRITNNGTALCCPIMYRWAVPKAQA
jgi:hypothetical protein